MNLSSIPRRGVGKVERIETQEIGGVATELIIVRILSNNVTLMVPVSNAKQCRAARRLYSGLIRPRKSANT